MKMTQDDFNVHFPLLVYPMIKIKYRTQLYPRSVIWEILHNMFRAYKIFKIVSFRCT